MDTKYVVSQLITAVIVIITTILTVRFTQLGSFAVSHKTKERLIAMILPVLMVIVPLVGFFLSMRILYRIAILHGSAPASQQDVVLISFSMVMLYILVKQIGNGIRAIWQQWRKP